MEQAIGGAGLTIFLGLFILAGSIFISNLRLGISEQFYRSDEGIIIKKSSVEAIDVSRSEFVKVYLSHGNYIILKTNHQAISDWFAK